jgi:hypothetical protein
VPFDIAAQTSHLGSGASFILMMLPPKSGRKAVRIRNASSVAALSKIYGFLISTWISDSSHDKEAAASSDWSTEFRTQLIAQALEIDTIKELTDLATWEGSIRGAWPSEEYLRLSDVQTEMISGLGQVGSFVASAMPLSYHHDVSSNKTAWRSAWPPGR